MTATGREHSHLICFGQESGSGQDAVRSGKRRASRLSLAFTASQGVFMSRQTTLQQAMDSFIRHIASDTELLADAEMCMEMLAQYLIHYSDLFQDMELAEEADFNDWEEGLEEHMTELLQGDIDPVNDLGQLPLNALDAEHLRDFLGWFVLRESSDADLIQAYSDVLQKWIAFLQQRGWRNSSDGLRFLEILAEVTPTAVRAARLSRVLFHFVRSGGGVPLRLRGKRFSRFVEGHGRVVNLEDNALHLNFDNQDREIGPVILPRPIIDMVEQDDVFDVEMGLRGDLWVMVDIGAIYPACIYVEAEEYQGLDKIIF
jgi:hypothetical protein